MHKNQPKTVVPGARRAVDEKGKPAFGKKGRKRIPLWDMPEPLYYDHHFKDAGSRRLAEAEVLRRSGDIDKILIENIRKDLRAMKSRDLVKLMSPKRLDMHTVAVPVYRGVDSKIANHIRSQYRRAERKSTSDKSALGFIKDLVSS